VVSSIPDRLTPGTHSMEGWMGLRDGLGVLEQGKISRPPF